MTKDLEIRLLKSWAIKYLNDGLEIEVSDGLIKVGHSKTDKADAYWKIAKPIQVSETSFSENELKEMMHDLQIEYAFDNSDKPVTTNF